MKSHVLAGLLAASFLPVAGQDAPLTTTVLEDLVAATGSEGGQLDLHLDRELLDDLRRRPVNLNTVPAEILHALHLLTPVQITRLLEYRTRMGGFLDVHELQAVPGLDLPTIRSLLPYVRVGDRALDDQKTSFGRMLREGNRQLYVRWQRRLERARGYREPEAGASHYLGSPDWLYLRFRQTYGNQFSIGWTAEKDPGEPFLRGQNSHRGVDFHSGHFFLRRLDRVVRTVAIGDYSVSLGQGLLLHNGFGLGKSVRTAAVARGGPVLRPYTSVHESNFLRGSAATLVLHPHLSATTFVSRKKRTATLREADGQLVATSLSESGLHRTENELGKRRNLEETIYGTTLRYQPDPRFRISINALRTGFSLPLEPKPSLHNRHAFHGHRLTNTSGDYFYRYRNLTFFGELARSFGTTAGAKRTGNGNAGGRSHLSGGSTIAIVQGVLLTPTRSTEVAALYRNYGQSYHALNARPFGESTYGRNERGLYLSVTQRLGLRWEFNAYADHYAFPDFRFRSAAPATGRDYRVRLSYRKKRRLATYLEWRRERRETTTATAGQPSFRTVRDRVQTHLRYHVAWTPTDRWDYRARIDLGATRPPGSNVETGWSHYQQVSYRLRPGLILLTRMAAFDTPGFDVRFYQYENGLRYNARVLPYYGRGFRQIVFVRYKPLRGLTLEARCAGTLFTDGRALGSGLERLDGTTRTDVGFQLIWTR